MAYTRRQVPREKIAEARHLYEQTLVPVRDIATLLGFSRNTLQRRLVEWGWKKRQQGALDLTRLGRSSSGRPQAVRQARPRKGSGEQPQSAAERKTLAERIQAVAEREIEAVEQVLKTLGGSDQAETESAARTLASLARTLRKLVQLDATTNPKPDHDEPIPRDLGELRRSLARKLEALIAGDAASLPLMS